MRMKTPLCLFAAMAVLLMMGCSGDDEEPGPVGTRQSDWRKNSPKPEKRVEQQAQVEPIKEKPKQETAPRKVQEIVSPVDQFEIVKTPPHSVRLVTDGENLANRDQFALVSVPVESVNGKSHYVELPKTERESPPATKRELPDGFEKTKNSGYADSGWPLRIRCLADSSEMVFQPGGVAYMGSDNGPENARPTIRVVLKPFYIDVTEVTVDQYDRFRQSRQNEGIRIAAAPNSGAEANMPVLGLTYNQARVYCLWAGKTLPNEAQWEFAARGTEGARYPWRGGNPIWQHAARSEQIFPVASERFDKTPDGIFDLAGNALEWCNDWYYPDTFQRAADSLDQPVRDFAGPGRSPEGNLRVVKGGGDWSAWHRQGVSQRDENEKIGFRGVLELSDSEN